jgi:hypothetical protein
MSMWGARHVDGVDTSAEGIEAARRLFGSDTVHFTQETAERVDEVFPTRTFDLIVSLETIEHVEDPHRFLDALKRLISRTGTIIISCPNDWWYYPSASQSNPYHRRKYRFEEFKALTQEILGEAQSWYLGAPISGFANVATEGSEYADAASPQILMLKQQLVATSLLLPAEYKMGPTPETCSYFVGVWGADCEPVTAALLPLGMNSFRDEAAFSAWGPGRVNQIQSENSRLSGVLAEAQRESAEQRAQLEHLRQQAETSSLEAERLSLTLQAEEIDKQRLMVQLKHVQLCLESNSPRPPMLGSFADTSGTYKAALAIVWELQQRLVDPYNRALQYQQNKVQALTEASDSGDVEDVKRENRKLIMQTHALTEERELIREQINRLQAESDDVRKSLERGLGSPATGDVRAVSESLANEIGNLRSRLWLLEAETEVYRKFRSRIPAWIVPTLRRWARRVTRNTSGD